MKPLASPPSRPRKPPRRLKRGIDNVFNGTRRPISRVRIAYLEDAEQSVVSDVVTRVLKERGALVTEHSMTHARFRALNPGAEYSFSKSG
jgi:hypothetical protein